MQMAETIQNQIEGHSRDLQYIECTASHKVRLQLTSIGNYRNLKQSTFK